MRLVVETDTNRVVAVDALESLLSPSTGGVAVDRVSEVLRAVRTAASALRPATFSPDQLEAISMAILGAAGHASALVNRAPAGDEDAAAVKATLVQLGMYVPPDPAP